MIEGKRRGASVLRARQRRYVLARKKARAIAELLARKYGARRVVLIGSLRDPARFDFHSDIDLCVEGIPADSFYRAAGEALVQAGAFDVDLIPGEHASERTLVGIAEGDVLYEQSAHADR
jgi:predicted nucleotidyltransferase